MAEASSPPSSTTSNSENDVIAFLDIDSFEVQLFINKSHPEFRGFPCIVADSTGRIVSVSHEAKKLNISRAIRVPKAKTLCPDLRVITKPNRWGKPDAQTTRHGSWAVFDSIKSFCDKGLNIVVEYHSSDGFYIDLTEEMKQMKENDLVDVGGILTLVPHHTIRKGPAKFHTDGEGFDDDLLRLMFGLEYLRALVEQLGQETGVTCSVGVSSNKLVAKYACRLNRPAGMAVLPILSLQQKTEEIRIKEIPGFGKRTGEIVMAKLDGIWNLKQLDAVPFNVLVQKFDEAIANTLYDGARGISNEKVIIKGLNNCVTCAKNFPGAGKVLRVVDLNQIIEDRVGEMEERLQEEKERHFRTTESLCLEISFTHTTKIKRIRFKLAGRKCNDQAVVFDLVEKAYKLLKPTEAVSRIALVARDWKNIEVDPTRLKAPQSQQNLGTIYQLKITLQDSVPKIWRLIQVEQTSTFRQLHHSIVESIGWEYCFNHEFVIYPRVICIAEPNPYLEGLKEILPERLTLITMLLKKVGDEILYQHGWEEQWRHKIKLEVILPKQPGISYPLLLDGARAAPPEDESDIFDHNEIVVQLTDSEGAAQLHSDGLYLDYDPGAFDPSEVVFGDHEDSESEDEDEEEAAAAV